MDLELLKYKHLLVEKTTDRQYLKCVIRNKFLVATPEEFVRQLFLLYIIEFLGKPKSLLAVEKQINYNQLSKRIDIMGLDKLGNPKYIIECKSPSITLNNSTLDQISNYNHILKAPYSIITNGKKTFAAHIDFEKGTTKRIHDLSVI